jgi:outer membrane protein OmpA-like peptidoglycan-associated protein/tetratricopeptide (TPR) repeat protein
MKRVLLLLLISFVGLGLSGQNISLSRADNLYRLYAYSEALDGYQKILKRTPDNEYLIQQIAYCYEKMGLYKEALNFYEKHITGKLAKDEDFYQYASLLLIDGQFQRAKEEFEKYNQKNPGDKRSIAQIERIDNFKKLNLLQLVDSVKCEPFNTRFSDMSPAFFKNKLAFVSARDSSGGKTYSWNNQPFLDIYELENTGGKEFKISKIKGINTSFHEGPLVFTNGGNTIWFTRNDQKFTGLEQEQTNNLKIYTSDWDGKSWGKNHEFQYNSNTYSVGHPAFSRDGNTMYFASNMKGTMGETDLFKVKKIEQLNKKGETEWVWSKPENMGKQFNTTGKEMFPFVDADGILYFASDGLIGFGGLDIFAAFPVADSFNIINLGQPVNSTYDDFGFIFSDDFSEGYFTSNRPGGVGSDDIYSFRGRMQKLSLIVKSLTDGRILKNASVKYTVDGVVKDVMTTDPDGLFSLDVDFRKSCIFQIMCPGFISKNDTLKAYDIIKIPNHEKIVYLDNTQQLELQVLNEEDGNPLAGVNVELSFGSGNTGFNITDSTGIIKHTFKSIGDITVFLSKDHFLKKEITIPVDNSGKCEYKSIIKLTPVYEGKTFVFENLYYDKNSSFLRPDAALVLDPLYKIMVENPDLKIELSSHTDSRAPAEYNLWLSQRRAQKIVDYLVFKGIDKNRLVAIGYGESKLLNKCSDGVDCSEEEHQKNRRTEFKVIGIK